MIVCYISWDGYRDGAPWLGSREGLSEEVVDLSGKKVPTPCGPRGGISQTDGTTQSQEQSGKLQLGELGGEAGDQV